MKNLFTIGAAILTLAAPAFAEGDATKGEKAFKKCKSCHKIEADDGTVIYKGGKTGPNLYGVIGRVAGTQDFKYGAGLTEAAAAELVWTEDALAEFIANPKKYLEDNGFAKKTKMSFKLKKGGNDVAAYLASVGPAPEAEVAPDAETETETEETKTE